MSEYDTSSVDLNRSRYPNTLDAAILLNIYIYYINGVMQHGGEKKIMIT